jgi:hypothetical protein
MPAAVAMVSGSLHQTQVDPRDCAVLCATDDSSPPTLLHHGHLQLVTQCQDPTATDTSEPQDPCFATLQCQASLPTEHGGPVLTTKPSCGRAPSAPSKSKNPPPPLSGNLPFCKETCFPKAQKGPAFPTVPNHGKAPLLC